MLITCLLGFYSKAEILTCIIQGEETQLTITLSICLTTDRYKRSISSFKMLASIGQRTSLTVISLQLMYLSFNTLFLY